MAPPRMTETERKEMIKRAVQAFGSRLLDSAASAEDVRKELRRVEKRLAEPDDDPRRREEMLVDYRRRLRERGRRGASRAIARKYAHDRADRTEVESLAKKIERWDEKFPDMSGLPGAKSVEPIP